jgi:hypothetical protein
MNSRLKELCPLLADHGRLAHGLHVLRGPARTRVAVVIGQYGLNSIMNGHCFFDFSIPVTYTPVVDFPVSP